MMAALTGHDGGSLRLDRRRFLAVAGGSLLSIALGERLLGMPAGRRISKVGVQLYTVRDALTKDLDGSLARVAAIGYREVELAGYRSHTVAEFKAALDRHGLVAPSTHIAIERIRDELPAVLDEAHMLGHQYVVAPNIADEKSGLDGYRRAADVLNHAGSIARRSGITIGYHNHGTELTPIDGHRPYDVLLERTEPSLVAMEMDIYWMVTGGGDPLAYFKQYPGRFRMVHVKDMDATPKHAMTEVGKGVIDWKGLFEADPAIEHYFVEHDYASEPFASIATSYAYLSKLEF
jgi:sugar phosphate isomerase/epimerase